MSEEELVFLIAVTVVMPILALLIILNYQKARLKIKREHADQSLTTSELNTLIDESVSEATAPLNERMAELEERLRLSESGSGSGLRVDQNEPRESTPEDVRFKTLGRTRS